jgi:hypothetical protein
MINFTDEQKDILSQYTNDFSNIEQITYYDYTRASAEKVSKMLDDYHVLWFHDDRGNMYLVPK